MWHELNGGIAYQAGANGTVNVPEGASLVQIVVHSTAGGTVTIFGGTAIPIIANAPPTVIRFNHTLWQANAQNGQALVFTGTDSYFVETILQR